MLFGELRIMVMFQKNLYLVTHLDSIKYYPTIFSSRINEGTILFFVAIRFHNMNKYNMNLCTDKSRTEFYKKNNELTYTTMFLYNQPFYNINVI